MLGHGRTIWIPSWNGRHLRDGLVPCLGKQLVGLRTSVPESLLNLWSSEGFAAGEFFCGNESPRKGTRMLFEVSPWLRSFSKVHTHIVAFFLLKYLWVFDILASFLSAVLVSVFSLSSSLHASIPFSLDYSFMPASRSLSLCSHSISFQWILTDLLTVSTYPFRFNCLLRLKGHC